MFKIAALDMVKTVIRHETSPRISIVARGVALFDVNKLTFQCARTRAYGADRRFGDAAS